MTLSRLLLLTASALLCAAPARAGPSDPARPPASSDAEARPAAVRVEVAVDPFSFGPHLALELAAGEQLAAYGKELARRLRVGSTGSGFFVNADGYLVTNAHVVLTGVRFRGLHFTSAEWDSMRRLLETVRDVWVTVGVGEKARSYLADPVAVAEELDLALLRVVRPPGDQTRFAFLPIAPSDEAQVAGPEGPPWRPRSGGLAIGDRVRALGFPEQEFEETSGEIMSLIHGWEVHEDMQLTRATDPVTGEETIIVNGTAPGPVLRLQHSAPTGHGSSGGPLVDDRGRVVGVAYALLSDENGAPRTDLNLAVASNVLCRFLREHGIAYTEAGK